VLFNCGCKQNLPQCTWKLLLPLLPLLQMLCKCTFAYMPPAAQQQQ
jgi:hypothetical protein